jgi:8-oxo-dGTP diphosphatase
MTAPLVQVTAALLWRDDTLFMARRGPGQKHAGLWELPGGKVEAGESPEQALAREIQEELSLDVQCGPLLARSTSPELPGLELLAFVCEIIGGNLQLREHDTCAWVPLAELDRYPMTALDRLLIPQLKETHPCHG